MNRLFLRVGPPLVAAIVVATGCSGVSGPHKVVINQGVCGNIRFLNMNLNQTNRVILDNTTHSEDQTAMAVTLEKFPVIVKGEVPQGSTIADKLSTIQLHADAGKQQSVDLVPTFTGTYKATCAIAIKQGAGSQVSQHDISFQIK